MKDKKLSPREREFCRRFVSCGNFEEAARLSGFTADPKSKSQELLSREDVVSEIRRLSSLRRQTMSELAQAGYQRLAFGSISDAVSLLYMENPTQSDLQSMDLFSVAEIKRPKDGSMEIKFFDRLKALEKLCEDHKEESGATPVYDAILRGALAIRDTSEENESNEA